MNPDSGGLLGQVAGMRPDLLPFQNSTLMIYRLEKVQRIVAQMCMIGSLAIGLTNCKKRQETVADRAQPAGVPVHPLGKHASTVVEYERSKYSPQMQPTGAEFGEITEEEKEVAKGLLDRLDAAGGRRRVYEKVLEEARLLTSELILDLAFKILESPDADIRAQGLMLVDGITDEKVVTLLEKGFQDVDLDVRQLAMETALILKSPKVENLVVKGLGNDDQTIRQTAFQLGLNQEGELAERTLVSSIQSPHQDLGMAGLTMAENQLSKGLVPTVFGALSHPAEEVRENAKEMLFFFFHKNFSSPSEAESWWRENQQHYDDQMVYEGPLEAQ
jgi:hypothetical protein